jgi:hypothetical protein
LAPAAELQWWYQFYFATERGRAGYDKYRTNLQNLSGKSPHQNGISIMPRLIALQVPSTILIMSTL